MSNILIKVIDKMNFDFNNAMDYFCHDMFYVETGEKQPASPFSGMTPFSKNYYSAYRCVRSHEHQFYLDMLFETKDYIEKKYNRLIKDDYMWSRQYKLCITDLIKTLNEDIEANNSFAKTDKHYTYVEPLKYPEDLGL